MSHLKSAAAFFDLDGTLLPDTSCDRELVSALRRSGRLPTRAIVRGVSYSLRAARRGAAAMWGVRGYLQGWPDDEFARFCRTVAHDCILPRSTPEGLRRLQWHRESGHVIVLMTGAPRQVAEPLGDVLGADVVIAGSLAADANGLTGWLLTPTPRGHEKARLIQQLAADDHLSLEQSWAYANSANDIPHMALTGHPVAVNPGPLLARLAPRQGWPVLWWLPPPRSSRSRTTFM